MKLVVASTVQERFPQQRTALLGPVDVAQLNLEVLEQVIEECRAACQERKVTPDTSPEIAHWRSIFEQMGASPKYRSSVEFLLERFTSSGDLPRIHPIVNLYNWLSLRHLTPMAGYDRDHLEGELELRLAQKGEAFTPLGVPKQIEKTKNGEVVYSDREKVVCRYWNLRDCHETRIRPETKRVVFIADLTDSLEPDATLRLRSIAQGIQEALEQDVDVNLE